LHVFLVLPLLRLFLLYGFGVVAGS